jgi:D-alanyl-D-alanine carboxypeptidase/D-alanyl-D-alanine-endopeptidase (penicillin-binding protein 4)
MRIEVVSAPTRYRWSPLLALVVVALVPVVGLTALVLWSDEQADAHEAADEAPPDEPAVRGAVADPLSTSVFSYRRTPQSVAAVADDNRLAEAMGQLHAFVDDRSCAAVSVDGRPVSGHNATTPVIPASNQKLLVGAAALRVLGPQYRYTTSVAASAPVDGVVQGDVHLVGGGDPLLVSGDYPTDEDPYPEFGTTSLDQLADAVVAAGVTRIEGDVVGDGSRYDDEWFIDSWGPDVAFVEAGPYDALVVNDARTLGRSGRQPDPNSAAAREFARLLENRGVTVDGWDTGIADPALPVLASIESEPMSTVVTEMLTNSDDDTAEMLLKELGYAETGEGTVGAGLSVVDRTMRALGVPMEGTKLVDASGLSSANRLTCAAVLGVLDQMADTPLRAALPVAASTGTLQAEFVGSPLAGRLAAKTGTLDNPPDDLDPPAVKALAGYVDADDGSTISFVLILNAADVTEPDVYGSYWGALVDRLAAYPTGPGPDAVAPR